MDDKEQTIQDGFAALHQTMLECGITDPFIAHFRQEDGGYITCTTPDWLEAPEPPKLELVTSSVKSALNGSS